MADLEHAVATRLPPPSEVWERTFLNVVSEWAVPLPTGQDGFVRFKSSGKTITVEFDSKEWFSLIVGLYVHSVEDGDLSLEDVVLRDDLWSDELYHLFFSGAPCIAVRGGDLVALQSPHGEKWISPRRRARGRAVEGTWTADRPR